MGVWRDLRQRVSKQVSSRAGRESVGVGARPWLRDVSSFKAYRAEETGSRAMVILGNIFKSRGGDSFSACFQFSQAT